MNNETRQLLQAVYNSLNKISIKGHKNAMHLAGCLQILGDLLTADIQGDDEIQCDAVDIKTGVTE